MAFCSKRTLSPRERFESELKEKQAARETLAERLNAAEAALGEKRDAAERLAIAGATDAPLDRAETHLRAAEDRAVTLRAALGQPGEQIAANGRELDNDQAPRDSDQLADAVARMVARSQRASHSLDDGS